MHPVAARRLAEHYLAEELPRRWLHVQGVSARADKISNYVDSGAVLVTAAWLHDVGYASTLRHHGFHPLDGAIALREEVDDQVCGLIAFHSAAIHEADALGLTDILSSDFVDERSLIRDLLWYLDMTTGPDGTAMSFGERMSDVRDRYPAGHYVIRALDKSMSDRHAAVVRAQTWLESTELGDQV